jgi:hypothetical protein
MTGTSGLGFTGTTGGIQGTTGGATGFTGATRTGGFAGGTAVGPQQTNPFRATYANPYALGYAGATGQAAFGQALVGTTTTGLGQTTPGLGTGTGAPGGIVFASSFGVRRAPAYTTTLGFEYRPPNPVQLQANLQTVISRSELLSDARDNIRVAMAGRVAVLQGTVASPRERRLAEALVRLEPGVAGVDNQLVIPPRRRSP